MMKLNLGCGQDSREGYHNVDLMMPCDELLDLGKLPWPWQDGIADEILMLDFLEHFPYGKTDAILQECWRVLSTDGFVDIQVPDFEICSDAANVNLVGNHMCNFCGGNFRIFADEMSGGCSECGKGPMEIAQAAMNRLYGGQDVEGNWHYTAFTKRMLQHKLMSFGFGKFKFLEEEHQRMNWNFKMRAFKLEDPWG